MANNDKLRGGLVGLGFGAEFTPMLRSRPCVSAMKPA